MNKTGDIFDACAGIARHSLEQITAFGKDLNRIMQAHYAPSAHNREALETIVMVVNFRERRLDRPCDSQTIAETVNPESLNALMRDLPWIEKFAGKEWAEKFETAMRSFGWREDLPVWMNAVFQGRVLALRDEI